MRFYDRFILPKLLHFACGLKPVRRQREKVVPHARGRVLEIGIGSGLNLPFYDSTKVTRLWGLEPSLEMRRVAERATHRVGFEVELIGLSAEEIPLDDDAVDTVLITYTLCTIVGCEPALREMSRVLKPGGELMFCEHGAAPDDGVRRWQDRLNPIWKRVGGGCNLNRPIPDLIERAGFEVTNLETMYIPGWRPASFNYWGRATPKTRTG